MAEGLVEAARRRDGPDDLADPVDRPPAAELEPENPSGPGPSKPGRCESATDPRARSAAACRSRSAAPSGTGRTTSGSGRSSTAARRAGLRRAHVRGSEVDPPAAKAAECRQAFQVERVVAPPLEHEDRCADSPRSAWTEPLRGERADRGVSGPGAHHLERGDRGVPPFGRQQVVEVGDEPGLDEALRKEGVVEARPRRHGTAAARRVPGAVSSFHTEPPPSEKPSAPTRASATPGRRRSHWSAAA